MVIGSLIKASQIIGQGLENNACRIELKSIGGDGVLWRRKSDSADGEVWCSKQAWQKLVLAITDIPEADNLPSDFIPCVTVAAIEAEMPWLLDSLELIPSQCGLLPEIYPVLTLTHPDAGEISFALINWPQKEWESVVTNWSPFVGVSTAINVSLMAGYNLQSSESPKLPQVGAGVWLEGQVRVERGEALLWCDGPLSTVTLQETREGGQVSFSVDELLSELSFIQPPVCAEIAKVEIPLSQLGTMMIGDVLTGKLEVHAEVRLYRGSGEQQSLLGTANLQRSGAELLAQITHLYGDDLLEVV